MIVARQKRKENIAEYLLYMWQVEDLIRANHFDIDAINRTVVARYDQPETVRKEISQWYEELIEMMRSEGVMEKGHIQLNKNVIIVLTDLHLRLLKSPKEMVYGAAYYKTLPYIVQLRAKSGGEEMSAADARKGDQSGNDGGHQANQRVLGAARREIQGRNVWQFRFMIYNL